MASTKILEQKKLVVDEIVNKLKSSESVIIFQYQGLTVEELSELRKELKNVDSEVKVYKNTLLKRAADELNLNLQFYLVKNYLNQLKLYQNLLRNMIN